MAKSKFIVKAVLKDDQSKEDENKQIMAIYQDCFLCGSRRKAVPPKIERLNDMGYEVLLVGFTNPIAQKFIAKAVELGIGQMPFYTDGKHFASTIDKMIELIEPKKNQNVKKTEELKDGANSEI